jgi:hypothetical protein
MDRNTLRRALARVPYYMRQGVLDYLYQGCPPGDFLRAVLENDLHLAGLQADNENQRALIDWVAVLDALPLTIWGSRKKVDAHLASHILRKQREEQEASCKR